MKYKLYENINLDALPMPCEAADGTPITRFHHEKFGQ